MSAAMVAAGTVGTTAQRLAIHLLVVDDDDVDRERVLRLLTRADWDVHSMQAANGADALRLVREHEFDCVMLDNQLGAATGAELLPALHREALRDCPIIMITGAGNEGLAVQALRDGAADYLPKFQLSTDILTRAIQRALEHQQMRREIDSLKLKLQRRVEEQAAQIVVSRRDLRAILDHTPSVVGYWDSKLRNRFGNRAHRSWLGVNARTLPGRHLRDVIGPLHFARYEGRINAVLKGQPQAFGHDFVATVGGTTRHALFNLRPDTDDEGVVRGFYATATDVTAIRQAQSRAEELARFAEAIIDTDPVGCGVYRADGHCVMSNRALDCALGTDAERRGRLGLWDWLAQHAPALVEPARATLEDGQQRRCDVELIGGPDPMPRLDCRLARILREGQAHLLLFANDVTEQRKVLDALVLARDSAEVAMRAKSAFLANMSHEIRTPMNAIVGLSRLALEDELPAGARDDLDKVHTAAVALMGLLDDVLDHSKIEAGHLRFEQVGFNLEQVLQRTVDVFAARVGQKGLELVVDLPPELPLQLVGDALRLSQVLNNLVGNAVKFTEHGHVHVEVQELPTADAQHCLLRFSVSDSGIGIDVAHHAGLFNAFTQADSSITRRFGGTGLGLTICRRLVGMMGGEIGMNSVLGRGSEFWFTAALLRDTSQTAAVPTQVGLEGLRVLLVDESCAAARGVQVQLQAWKVRVTCSREACGTVAQVEQARGTGDPFNVVLLDGQMLAADEHRTLLRGLRHAGDGTARPVVVVMFSSAHTAASDTATDFPADVVLVKPMLATPLLAAMQKAAALAGLRGPAASAGERILELPSPTSQAEWLLRRAAPLAGARVLLVEDNMVNQIVARRILERMGLEVRVADDGVQALAALEDPAGRPFDAVLMDLHMPVMDGLEATRRIRGRAAWAALPVIAMTAAALAEDRALCFEAGMVDHVAKPLVPEGLLDTLLRWIPHEAPVRQSSTQAAMGAPAEAPAGGCDPQIPGLDYAALRRRVLGDDMLVWRLLTEFEALERDAGARLMALLAQADLGALQRSAHTLREASASLGLDGVAQACTALESALRTTAPIDAPTSQLATVLDAVLDRMRVVMARRGGPPGTQRALVQV